jgi:hypothetical protein
MPESDRNDGERREEHTGETPEEQAARLIGNSSLGTEGAQSLAARASEEDVAEVLRRLHERQAEMEALGEVGPDDFFDTPWAEVDYDNQLSDLIGGGADVDIPEGGTWQELADTLGKLRDGMGNAQPFDADQFDKDVLARYEREKNAAEPPGPRTPESEGQSKVAINEDAQIIRAAANDSSLSGAAQLAVSNMGDVQPVAVDRLADAVGAMQEGLGGLEGHAVAAAAAAGGEDGQSIQGAASVATEAVNTAVQAAEQARGLADQLNAAIQGARQAAESALAASEQFRQTCDGIASRHGA